MDGIAIELTNVCNLRCAHCVRNKSDAPDFLPLALAEKILVQAKALNFQTISLTGGEVALYPDLEEFLTLVAEQGFNFNLVTNGYKFQENLLPVLTSPKIREGLTEVAFSLEGARPESHDALRGSGSFRKVVEAATLCEMNKIPFCLKSVVTNFNKEELTDLAILGSTLGALDVGFLHPFPTPKAINKNIIPSPRELRDIMTWIGGILSKTLRIEIRIEGFVPYTTLFKCPNILDNLNMDYNGNLNLCCNLSHVTRENGQPSLFGREWLGNLNEMTLLNGVIKHYHAVARLMEARAQDAAKLTDLTFIPCYWCLKHFGKLEWLRNYPESPWSDGILEEEGNHADF
jgi:MoaA/NifB/PqqE/SkfB family radical SAM enzyme